MAGHSIVKVETDDLVTILLDHVTASTAGASTRPARVERAFQTIITGSATVVVQATLDNTNWVALRTSTSSEAFSTAEPWPVIRANCTAYTSGTCSVYMAT